jgi:hypothetical protein
MFANLIYFGDTQPEQVLQTQSGMSVDTFGIGQFSKYERGQMISQDAAVSTLAESTGIIS